jgi:hypothetical protein
VLPKDLAGLGIEREDIVVPVLIYMMPSLTSGVASNEYLPPSPEPLRRVIQAPLSCLTLLVSICFSVE